MGLQQGPLTGAGLASYAPTAVLAEIRAQCRVWSIRGDGRGSTGLTRLVSDTGHRPPHSQENFVPENLL